MTKDELREALHRELLFYYFAQREPRLEILTRARAIRCWASPKRRKCKLFIFN